MRGVASGDGQRARRDAGYLPPRTNELTAAKTPEELCAAALLLDGAGGVVP
jgi:hypothetical protein